ncbi:MAG TPA: hypothetical protein VGE45_22705 [Chloroflexia bacterium]|jgi:hypothetical protein
MDSTYDISGRDLKNNRPIVVSDGPKNQFNPAISGPVVVWEDEQSSCDGCGRDIMGKDLANGVVYQVATGPNDQLYPAISGKSVAWLENGEKESKLLVKELDSNSKVVEVRSVGYEQGIDVLWPRISDRFLIWAEQRYDPLVTNSRSIHIQSYNRSDGRVTSIAQYTVSSSMGGRVEYALDGSTLAWEYMGLNLMDLSTGVKWRIETPEVVGLAIQRGIVMWSAGSEGFDIWGLNLKEDAHKPLPLLVADGAQLTPTIAGDVLAWANNGGTSDERIASTSLSEALATAPERQKALDQQEKTKGAAPPATAEHPQDVPGYTNPTVKGIHVAHGGAHWRSDLGRCEPGWYNCDAGYPPCNGNGCGAVDALGARQPTPYFGSYIVMGGSGISGNVAGDLDFNTGRADPWGPQVKNVMRTLSIQGRRITFRTWDTLAPNASGTRTPDHLAQQVLDHAWRSWLRSQQIQVNNEPNAEWPSRTNCKRSPSGPGPCWWPGRPARSWNDDHDQEFWLQVNEFYTDGWWAINYYRTNSTYCSQNPTNCNNLATMNIWTPPMAGPDYFTSAGQLPYQVLSTMIDTYDFFSYHLYYAPNLHANGFGGVTNWLYDSWFPSWLKNWITSGYDGSGHRFRSQVTEAGWPGWVLDRCGYTSGYDSSWRPVHWSNSWCNTGDGYYHYNDTDLTSLMSGFERHNAEAIYAWIVRGGGGNPAVGLPWGGDGLDESGAAKTWFWYYQQSSP